MNKMANNSDCFSFIEEELRCGICMDIPLEPVRLIVTDTDNFCLDTYCNELFCKQCIMSMFYFNDKTGFTHKCPICAREVSNRTNNYYDSFVEDKITKKIIHSLMDNKNDIQYSCKYNCGLNSKDYNAMISHYDQCTSRVEHCPSIDCNVLLKSVDEITTHNDTCVHINLSCVFCEFKVKKTTDKKTPIISKTEMFKNKLLDHCVDYHKIDKFKMRSFMNFN